MEQSIQRLMDWAISKNIELNGCAPKKLPNRGIGIVATRPIKPNQVILRVPTTTLRSLANTPSSITARLPGASTHAILAASLCLDLSATTTSTDLSVWQSVFPTAAEIRSVMPICWPSELRALLPHAAATLLTRQSAKFHQDWADVEAAFGKTNSDTPTSTITRSDFLYAWLLVNTRTFYYDAAATPSTSATNTTTSSTRRRDRDEHMVLQPIADLFNHSPHNPCHGAFTRPSGSSTTFFTVTATSSHDVGAELFIRYGPHSNDLLFVEYGFTLPPPLDQAWDETSLDSYLCPTLVTAGLRPRLEEAGFWARYMLDHHQQPCYRTHVALRALHLTPLQWRAFLDGERDEDLDRPAVDAALVVVLDAYLADVSARLDDVDAMTAGDEDGFSRRLLRDRWVQIRELVAAARGALQQ